MSLNYQGYYEFPNKCYFWCTSGNGNFSELPSVNAVDREKVEQLNSSLVVEPEKVLFQAQIEEEDAKEEEIPTEQDSLEFTKEEKIPPKDFT